LTVTSKKLKAIQPAKTGFVSKDDFMADRAWKKAVLFVVTMAAALLNSANAQNVYSVNIFGYFNLSIPIVAPVTFAWVSNPFFGPDNRLSQVLPDVPNGTTVYLFRNGVFEAYTFFQGWSGDTIIDPGEGFVLALTQNTAPNPTVLTFAGEVIQGTTHNLLPPGPSLRSCKIPISAPISLLSFVPGDGDLLALFNSTAQSPDYYSYFFDTLWDPFEPALSAPNSFWYFNSSGVANNWTINFTVNFSSGLASAPRVTSSSPALAPSAAPCVATPAGMGVKRAGSNVQVVWPTDGGQYQLETSQLLLPNSWSNATQTVLVTNGANLANVPIALSQAFLRLRLIPGQAPTLLFKKCSATSGILFWPASFSNFNLQQSDSLNSGAWASPGQFIETNGFRQVTIPISSHKFFRLKSI
jgi:hypothetical protein